MSVPYETHSNGHPNKETGNSNGGAIAAGVLVVCALVIGSIIVGALLLMRYFNQRQKKHFERLQMDIFAR